MTTLETTQTTVTTEQFLQEIHGEDALIYFNVGTKTWGTPRIYDEKLQNTFHRLNTTKDKDIYFIVNSGGTKNIQIKIINAVFIDWDSGKDENGNYFPIEIVKQKKSEFLPKLDEFPFKPTFVVETRNGYQVYWLICSCGVSNEQFISIQKQLSSYFDSDPTVYNPNRVMRLPGYYWVKPKKKCPRYYVSIIEYNPSRYISDDIISFLSSSSLCSTPTTEDKTTQTTGRISAHNNTYIYKDNTRSIIMGTKTRQNKEKITLNNMDEVAEYLSKQNLAEYMGYNVEAGEKGVHISCPFHKDSTPSASIYVYEGKYLLKCHSPNCSFESGTIVQVVERRDNLDEGQAVSKLMEQFNIEINPSWIGRNLKIIDSNIDTIERMGEWKDKYKNLYKCINRLQMDLLSKLKFAKEHMKLSNSDGKGVFFCSLREFEKVAKGYLYRHDQGRQNERVDRYCLLGLMRKLPMEDIPWGIWRNIQEVKSRKRLQYRIQCYEIPEYTESLLEQADITAKKLKEYGIRMNAISWDVIFDVFGKDKAVEIYPQVDSDTISHSSIRFRNLVEKEIMSAIKTKGYCRPVDVVSGIQKKHNWKAVTDRRVKKYIPGLLVKHSLIEVRATSELKKRYAIVSKGYPSIIVRKTAVSQKCGVESLTG